MNVARISGHSFLTAPINESSVVVDLGLHSGDFAMEVIRRFGCRVIGVEPVPVLFAALPDERRLIAEERAITADGLDLDIHLNRFHCATTLPALAEDDAETIRVAGTTLSELLDRHGIHRAALVKVDIEGAELGMIAAMTRPTAGRFDQLTVEFHDFLDSQQEEAVLDAIQRLESFGFRCIRFSRHHSGDILFVNGAIIPLSLSSRTLIIVRDKYLRGWLRVLKRLAGRFR